MLRIGNRILCLVAANSLIMVAVAVQADVVQDFDGGGSTYTLGGIAAVAGAGNPGNGLRLTPSINVAYGVAAFDLTDPGTFDRIQIDFDFRFSEFRNNDPANAADGFGVALLHTGTFGFTGLPAALNSYGAYEEPDFANSFGVGFDTWDNSGGLEGNSSVSLHFNGTVLDSVVVFPDLLLENEFYNHASILLEFVPGGANATVSVLDASDNVLETPFSNYFIAGMVPYESRLFLGARTGGERSAQDVDNLSVVYTSAVPEPGAAMSLGLIGLAGLISYRFRRK